jgi:predicted dehydrogenase
MESVFQMSFSMAKIRASVIGAGWYAAQNHIPALARRSDVILDGVSRLGQEELSKVKEHFGFAFASEDFQEVLSRRPDVVIVASPHHLHYQHARAAITSGAHVLCEKPMTLDVGEAWDLVALAKGHGRHLLVAHGYNYLPQVDHLTLKIAEGAIGTIEHAAVSFISPRAMSLKARRVCGSGKAHSSGRIAALGRILGKVVDLPMGSSATPCRSCFFSLALRRLR